MAEPAKQMDSEVPAAFHQFLVLDDMQRLERNARGQRVAAEGRAMAPGSHQIQHFGTRHEGGDGQQPAPQRLTENQAVGMYVFVLAREQAGGRLPLVLVLGNAVVIVLEALVVSIQTTRLVLFEFFTRFMQGSGRAFRPLPPPPFTCQES